MPTPDDLKKLLMDVRDQATPCSQTGQIRAYLLTPEIYNRITEALAEPA